MASSCATSTLERDDHRTLAFGCDDIAVVGRLENGEYQQVEIESDILGHGWFAAVVDVRRVVRGNGIPPRLSIKYFAHTYMREDRDFLFVLSQTDDGYRVETAQLMSARPRLAAKCD